MLFCVFYRSKLKNKIDSSEIFDSQYLPCLYHVDYFVSNDNYFKQAATFIFQNENVSNIYVRVLESLENFNVDLADSFIDEDEENETQNTEEIQPAGMDAQPVVNDTDTFIESPKLIQ